MATGSPWAARDIYAPSFLGDSDGESINQGMNPDFAKAKKRKISAENAEEFILPAAKHRCPQSGVDPEEDTSDMDMFGTQAVDSAQDSNSFPGDSQSFPAVKFATDFGQLDSYDEASTSWSNSASVLYSSYSESKILSGAGDGKEDMVQIGEEDYHHLNVQWDDSDFLDECISVEHGEDSKQQRTESLHEFLACSGMSPNLYALSSETLDDQGAQLGRRKPTIDQEFEQYFSTLML